MKYWRIALKTANPPKFPAIRHILHLQCCNSFNSVCYSHAVHFGHIGQAGSALRWSCISTLLNRSSWRLIEHVNMGNKHALLQQLILEEVIICREVNLKAFCGGLQVWGLCDLLGCSAQLLQHLFVAGVSASITALQIRDAISSPCPTHNQEKPAAYIHFMTVLTLLEGVCI